MASETDHKQQRVVFFGTPDFAVPSLQKLIDNNYHVTAVVTQPPKPMGRHDEPIRSPIHELADENSIEVLHPSKLDKAFVDKLKEIEPDIAIIVAYGKILPQAVLEIPRLGFVNVHPSLLPKHRGPSPVASAILAGDKETGVSIMLIDKQMDHGPILLQEKMPMPARPVTPDLEDKLAKFGSKLLTGALDGYIAGNIKPVPQDHKQATTHHLLTRKDGEINWTDSASLIERKIRALSPWPGQYSCIDSKRLKILEVEVFDGETTPSKPGQISFIDSAIRIGTGTGALLVTKLQLEGEPIREPADFINGHQDLDHRILGPCPKK